MWVIFSILSAVFAAIMSITIKIGFKDINPFLSLSIRKPKRWIYKIKNYLPENLKNELPSIEELISIVKQEI